MSAEADLIQALRQLKPSLASRFKVMGIELFGSSVHGTLRPDSDIDLLIEFGEGADLFDLVGLGDFLEERLGRKVDIVPKRALRIELRDKVLKEAIPI